jgi:hypothetical protein
MPGTWGTCQNIADNDPDARCPRQDPSTCGTNGTCNGSGVCKSYDSLTQCSSSCNATIFTRTYCDGLGQCLLIQPEVCLSLTCNDSGCL